MALTLAARGRPLPPALLPHTSPAAAWQAVLSSSPELAFWPQLSRRGLGEQPWAWAGRGLPGLRADQPVLDAAAFEAELDQLYLAYLRHDLQAGALDLGVGERLPWPESFGPRLVLLGARLLGPVSLGLALLDEQDRPLLLSWERRDALAKHLHLRAAWLERICGGLADQTLICLEEPFLNALQSAFVPLEWPEATSMIVEALAGLRGGRGLAPGPDVDWAALLVLDLDVLICPAAEVARLLEQAAGLEDYLERGGIIAWALVPNDEQLLEQASPAAIAAEFAALLEQAGRAGVDADGLALASLLTVDGRLDHLPTARAERTLALLAEASLIIRAEHGLADGPALPASQPSRGA